MKTSFYSSMDLTDLVFENRNKAYGAYLLRKTNSQNMLKAMIVAMSLFVIGIYSPNIIDKLKDPIAVVNISDDSKWHDILVDPKIEKARIIKKAILTKLPKSNNANLFHVVKDDSLLTKEDPILKPEMNSTIGIPTGSDNVENPDGTISGNNTGSGPDFIESNGASAEAIRFAEVMPMFGSNEKDLYIYLSKNIRYPQIARDNHIEGKVILEFIIDKYGMPHSINILKGIGGGCDEEIIRVIQNMPRWKHGKHNGVPVSVKLVLPVQFKLK
ncbi:MAG: energy transducer TonB [Saprospiraceae bacterium]|nr:energy transducer TonB [Saprospiraceae bacterium]